MSLTVIHLISIPITNTSVDPARSIGVAIFNSDALAQVVAFIMFPILGALFAGGQGRASLLPSAAPPRSLMVRPCRAARASTP